MSSPSLFLCLLTAVIVVSCTHNDLDQGQSSKDPTTSSLSSATSIQDLLESLHSEFFETHLAPLLDVKSCTMLSCLKQFHPWISGVLRQKLLQVVLDSNTYDLRLPQYLISLEILISRIGDVDQSEIGPDQLCRLYDRIQSLDVTDGNIRIEAFNRSIRLFPKANDLYEKLDIISQQPEHLISSQAWHVSPDLVEFLKSQGIPVPESFTNSVVPEIHLIQLFKSAHRLDLLLDIDLLIALLNHGVRLRLVNVLKAFDDFPSAKRLGAVMPLYQAFWPTELDLNFPEHGRLSHCFFVDLQQLRDADGGAVKLAQLWQLDAVRDHYQGRLDDLGQYLLVEDRRFELLHDILYPQLKAFTMSDAFRDFIDALKVNTNALKPLLVDPELSSYRPAVVAALLHDPYSPKSHSLDVSEGDSSQEDNWTSSDVLRHILVRLGPGVAKAPAPDAVSNIDITEFVKELSEKNAKESGLMFTSVNPNPGSVLKEAFENDPNGFLQYAVTKTNGNNETLLHYASCHMRYQLLDSILSGGELGQPLMHRSASGLAPLDFAWRWLDSGDIDDRDDCIVFLALHALRILNTLQISNTAMEE